MSRQNPNPGYSGLRAPEWSSKLWDCCYGQDATKTCILSMCLPAVQYGFNVERLKIGTTAFAGDCFAAGSAYEGLYIMSLFVQVPLVWVLHVQTRGAIRAKYGIPEDHCTDCMVTTFCSPCALCQEHYQLTNPELDHLDKP
jgi:Cys-rich protein (TIGR01571 family)